MSKNSSHNEHQAQAYEIVLTDGGDEVSLVFRSAPGHEALVAMSKDLARRLAFDLVDSISRANHTSQHS